MIVRTIFIGLSVSSSSRSLLRAPFHSVARLMIRSSCSSGCGPDIALGQQPARPALTRADPSSQGNRRAVCLRSCAHSLGDLLRCRLAR
jgi:hypothetical protein